MATLPYQELINALGFTHVQKKHKEIYESWASEPIVWYFPNDDLDFIMDVLQFETVEKNAVTYAYQEIHKDPTLYQLMSFIQSITMIKAHPSDWLGNEAPKIIHPTLSIAQIQLMAILSLIPLARKDYALRGIETKHMMFNLNHLKGYIKNYRMKHQEVGIDLYGWTTYLASLGLIHLGSLHFMHHKYSEPFIFYRHKHTHAVIAFALEGIKVRVDGQIDGVNGIHHVRCVTSYSMDQEQLIAYPIHPKGYILSQTLSIDLKDYTCILKPGDSVIDFHIPTRSDYTLEGIRHSFDLAIEFFQNHYPEYDYRAFWCTSWLYSPQIDSLIKKPTSNILSVANQGYILPATPGAQSLYTFVFQTDQPDFDNIQPKTSLEKSVIDFVKSGNSINAGCYLYFIQDIKLFGNSPYSKGMII